MRPDDRDLNEEIRGHLALSIKERIERGENPEAARIAALREFGYVPAVHESMRRVWYSRWFDNAAALVGEMRIGLRSLLRSKGLTATVVVTLALGIGANAAIFSVVRGVLLRPLVNRGEDRLVYIRQSAPGIDTENTLFSVPEINDLKASSRTIGEFGDFSVVEITMLGLGEPRLIRAGVVGGSYFDVMGLRPVLGRLLAAGDDGPGAASAVVLTHRFWTSSFNSDPNIVGRTIRLGPNASTIVGVLEPSVPYPADTEIIGNMVTSPHHLGATMNQERRHRMTELFGRLAPGVSLEEARAELTATHAAIVRAHPDAYSQGADVRLSVTPLRDQISAPARTILLVLLAAAGVVFIIACSNVANLILARSVRREGELAVRAALGASRGALRRTLLAESLVLCGAGAILGVWLADPLVSIVARFAARFSVRALEVTTDNTILWVGAGLAVAAAVLLAYVPRLPSANVGLASGGLRITTGTNRRLRAFATTQIAFSFVLLAAAGMLVATLLALQLANSGVDTRQVLAIDVPSLATGYSAPNSGPDVYPEVKRRISELPGVEAVSTATFAPWRDAGTFAPFQFAVEGYTPANGEESPFARPRFVAPDYFAALGIQVIAGREFNDDDRRPSGDTRERVTIVSQSIARRFFPDSDALNRHLMMPTTVYGDHVRFRIVGVVADVDDVHVSSAAAMTIYRPTFGMSSRLFVRTSRDPHAIVPAVTRIIRELSPNQAVERPSTLEDIRAEILSPERLNAFVVSGFAAIALLIAVVGVAGVLAFSVSARVREFGVRLAIGSTPNGLLVRVLREGAAIVFIGVAVGVGASYAFAAVAGSLVPNLRAPGARPLAGAAAILIAAAVIASLMPAARASRVDVLQALRAE